MDFTKAKKHNESTVEVIMQNKTRQFMAIVKEKSADFFFSCTKEIVVISGHIMRMNGLENLPGHISNLHVEEKHGVTSLMSFCEWIAERGQRGIVKVKACFE